MNNLINIMIILNDWTNNISPYNTYYTLGINKNDYNSNYLKLGRNLLFLNNFVGTSILPNNGKILGYSLYENFSILVYNKLTLKDSYCLGYKNYLTFNNNNYIINLEKLYFFNFKKMNIINLLYNKEKLEIIELNSIIKEKNELKNKLIKETELNEIELNTIISNQKEDRKYLSEVIEENQKNEVELKIIIENQETEKSALNKIIKEEKISKKELEENIINLDSIIQEKKDKLFKLNALEERITDMNKNKSIRTSFIRESALNRIIEEEKISKIKLEENIINLDSIIQEKKDKLEQIIFNKIFLKGNILKRSHLITERLNIINEFNYIIEHEETKLNVSILEINERLNLINDKINILDLNIT